MFLLNASSAPDNKARLSCTAADEDSKESTETQATLTDIITPNSTLEKSSTTTSAL